jgi:hypothetical protein
VASKFVENALKTTPQHFTGSKTSIALRGMVIPGVGTTSGGFQLRPRGFQKSRVLCGGGLNSQIAPIVVRKGIGRISLLDDDMI